MPAIPLTLAPDPTDAEALQAWVEASADGIALRLMVDTGASRTAVPAVEPFVSRPQQAGRSSSGVFGAARVDPLVVVDTLRTGELSTRGLLVELQPQGWGYPPLLGLDVLRGHACHFRFAEQRIVLDEPRPAEDPWLPLATEPNGSPIVDLEWAGEAGTSAVWDTGAGATIVDRSWADAHPDLVTVTAGVGVAIDSTGASAGHAWGRLAPFTVGGLAFPEQPCAVVDLSLLNGSRTVPLEVVVGLPLMVQARWWFDFPRRLWSVHR